MPIFEYKCTKCGNKFEELVSGDRNKAIPCPSCKSMETEKLMSAVGTISMGKSMGPCGTSCASATSCASSGGGCCGGHGH
ncbi:MAG: FmdB family zinc ribbon protein [Fibrobacterota bacterium]|nr:zinc ribbon domain-containing protein [Chitinispirillaceae bacterium]